MRTKSNSGKFSFLAEQSQRPPRQSQQQQHSKNKSTKNLENYHKIHSHQQKNFVNKQPPQPQRTEPKKKKNKNQLDVESEIVYLEHHWSFWFDRYIGPNRSVEEYQSALVELSSVDNIQEFWRWYNHLPAVNQLQPGTSYHLMKTGVRPLWEDENNVHGGELTLKVKKSETLYVWEQLLLAVVGEQIALENNDEICGLSVSIRKTNENVISLWNKNQNVKLDSLVEQMKNLLPDIRVDNPTYKVHSVLMNAH